METNTQATPPSNNNQVPQSTLLKSLGYLFGGVLFFVIGASGTYFYIQTTTPKETPQQEMVTQEEVKQPEIETPDLVATETGSSTSQATTSALTTQEEATSSVAFKGETITGTAPFTVSFIDTGSISGIEYGDGKSCSDNAPGAPEKFSCKIGAELKPHTYTATGTYLVVGTRSLPSGKVGETTVIVNQK